MQTSATVYRWASVALVAAALAASSWPARAAEGFGATDRAPAVDVRDQRSQPLTEPTNWALLLGGMGVVAQLGWRRSKPR